MAVHDTEENGRFAMTERTIQSLVRQLRNHDRLYIIDNGSCQATKDFLLGMSRWLTVITNPENVGTAKAINQAWKHRTPGEYLVKMDNDVIIHDHNWLSILESAIYRQHTSEKPIGICALKRKDLAERPERTDWAHSELVMTQSDMGEKWIVVEYVAHAMGTVQMYNPQLIDIIGGLVQPGLYGFDDALAAIRCTLAGFYSAFVPGIEIDHIDTGNDVYVKWKQSYAGSRISLYHKLRQDYIDKKTPLYEPL